MKKAILAWALVMCIGTTQASWASSAPKHRYQATTQQVDKRESSSQDETGKKEAVDQKQKAGDEGVEAYSDTTDVDTAASDYTDDSNDRSYHSKYSLGNYDDPFDFFGSVFGKGALVVMVILCVLIGMAFFFAPIIIVFLIVRYLMRRHNDRVKLAEMAMDKGINVPEGERPIDRQSNEYLQKRGLRNMFLGLGLWAMFSIWNAEFLAGLGALIAFYGIGQIVIGSLPAIKKWWNNRHGNLNENSFNGTAI